jgi:hypothetical protein
MDLLGRTVTVLAGFTLALVFLPAASAASASVTGGTQVAYTAAAGEINAAKVFSAGTVNFGASSLHPISSGLLENLWARLRVP